MRSTSVVNAPQDQVTVPALVIKTLLAFAPLLCAFVYTWFWGEDMRLLRCAQSLGAFMIALSLKRALNTLPVSIDNYFPCLASVALFTGMQSVTRAFPPNAIFSVAVYSCVCLYLQIVIAAERPKANVATIAMHSALSGMMFYFLLEEYLYLPFFWFGIALISGSFIFFRATTRLAKLQASAARSQ